MIATPYVTRRATVEDLPGLMSLWKLEQLPAAALEKRFTEFQVVTDDAGKVLAAMGLKIAGPYGWLHHESIGAPNLSDQLREQLWNRLQVMIQNHGLERLWTDMKGPYWRTREFEPATPDQLKLLPAAFQGPNREWQSLTLRAAEATAALEREFAEIKTLQQQEEGRMRERIRWMKRIALGTTVAVFLLVVVWAVVMLKLGPKIFQR